MASEQQQNRPDLEAKARQGETVVRGGTGGHTVQAQENLAQGRSRGGRTRKEQRGTEGFKEIGREGGHSTQSGGGGSSAGGIAAGGGGAEPADDDDIDIDESTG